MFLLNIFVHTANVLGIFNDPFEFEGDYSSQINPVRQTVFEQVVSREAYARHLNQKPISEAIEEDCQHGPTLKELVSSELIVGLESRGFSATDLNAIHQFLVKFADQKIFRFLRNCPSALLHLDLSLKEKAAHAGKSFDLPILSSLEPLRGQTPTELNANLLEALFTKDHLLLTRSPEELRKAVQKFDSGLLHQLLGEEAALQDLEVFCTPAGQIFFYWLYQALNLHLIAPYIEPINQVKESFAKTLGNPEARAHAFKEKLLAANTALLFTQECDAWTQNLLTQDHLFLPVDQQNQGDGCFVFLRSDSWDSDYTLIPIEGYVDYQEGVMNLVLAKCKETGEKFLLAACHGSSTRAEDGRLQISLVKQKFDQLKAEHENLQLVIGIDANTKSELEVRLLHEHLDSLGLVATHVGPTTVKRRMVTAQHAKACKLAIDEEDYLITLKDGHYSLTHPTVGFSEVKPDLSQTLPNLNNLSDHYPVGVTLERL